MEVGYLADALIALGFRERKYDEAAESAEVVPSFASQLTVFAMKSVTSESPTG
jgi:hypothetical protein